MIEPIYLTLIAISLLYIFWIFFGELVAKLIGKKPCAICAAVLTTWVGLLIFAMLGYSIPSVIPAILMGTSIAGFMHRIEKNIKKNRKLALLKPLIIIFGTAFAYFVISVIYG